MTWKTSTRVVAQPLEITTIELDLGGIHIRTDDEFHHRTVIATLPPEAYDFPDDTPLSCLCAELPARLLPVFRRAVAELERIVNP